MNTLQETIENTLINNLEIDVSPSSSVMFAGLEYESVKRTASYIADEMKQVAIGFANQYHNHKIRDTMDDLTVELHADRLFETYLKERYSK